ncbi:MAG: efflux RND transporter periplasmic adaptor subunit, partial [Chitinivibrionales bacterium]|nr:efflux RND transporter periplasmic adaptor subunit [Chitinivibrionales bacterium]
ANSSNPLVIINQIAPIRVDFAVPEEMLVKVRQAAQAGEPEVAVFFTADSARVYSGKLTFIDNAVDTATGTILLKATIPNADRALWPGQFVAVRLVLSLLKNATVVPAAAVQSSQRGDFVYVVVSGDSAQMRSIVAGAKYNDWVVIEKGVQPGERVVTDGQFGLTPGSAITIRSGLTPPVQGDKPR